MRHYCSRVQKGGFFATSKYILLKNYKHVFFMSLEKIENDRPEQMVCLKIPELNYNKGHEDFQNNIMYTHGSLSRMC